MFYGSLCKVSISIRKRCLFLVILSFVYLVSCTISFKLFWKSNRRFRRLQQKFAWSLQNFAILQKFSDRGARRYKCPHVSTFTLPQMIRSTAKNHLLHREVAVKFVLCLFQLTQLCVPRAAVFRSCVCGEQSELLCEYRGWIEEGAYWFRPAGTLGDSSYEQLHRTLFL